MCNIILSVHNAQILPKRRKAKRSSANACVLTNASKLRQLSCPHERYYESCFFKFGRKTVIIPIKGKKAHTEKT